MPLKMMFYVNQFYLSHFSMTLKVYVSLCVPMITSLRRQRSGFLGWGGDKSEIINGYESKIYNVSGVEIITRTRTEHMTAEDRERFKG